MSAHIHIPSNVCYTGNTNIHPSILVMRFVDVSSGRSGNALHTIITRAQKQRAQRVDQKMKPKIKTLHVVTISVV